jgi:hypothetical protein
MQVFELVVRPHFCELHCPKKRKDLGFPTLLGAFAYAQLSMGGEAAEMVVHFGEGVVEHVPLYRMMA